jgi:hypothetical protein
MTKPSKEISTVGYQEKADCIGKGSEAKSYDGITGFNSDEQPGPEQKSQDNGKSDKDNMKCLQ